MSLILEDGSQVVNANTYASLAYASTYFTNIGKGDDWSNLDNQSALLIRAQQYMYRVYHNSWAGYRVASSQALDWPRVWVPILDVAGGFGPYPQYISETSIPDQVKQAQCELALRFGQNGDLITDIPQEVLSEQVGSVKVTYNPNSPGFTIYREINLIIAAFLDSNNSANTKLIR